MYDLYSQIYHEEAGNLPAHCVSPCLPILLRCSTTHRVLGIAHPAAIESTPLVVLAGSCSHSNSPSLFHFSYLADLAAIESLTPAAVFASVLGLPRSAHFLELLDMLKENAQDENWGAQGKLRTKWHRRELASNGGHGVDERQSESDLKRRMPTALYVMFSVFKSLNTL
jgi:hypothetical protein